MKNLLWFAILVLSLTGCKSNQYQTQEVKIPVIQKYQTTRQFSVFPPERIWVAKLANGDSIKTYSMPPDTVTFVYYKKIK